MELIAKGEPRVVDRGAGEMLEHDAHDARREVRACRHRVHLEIASLGSLKLGDRTRDELICQD